MQTATPFTLWPPTTGLRLLDCRSDSVITRNPSPCPPFRIELKDKNQDQGLLTSDSTETTFWQLVVFKSNRDAADSVITGNGSPLRNDQSCTYWIQ